MGSADAAVVAGIGTAAAAHCTVATQALRAPMRGEKSGDVQRSPSEARSSLPACGSSAHNHPHRPASEPASRSWQRIWSPRDRGAGASRHR